jgi:hypothetical protein
LADRYVQTARVGDRTAVIVAGSSPRLIAPPSVDASSALATIKAIQPGLADGSLSAALPLVRSLLPGQKDRAVEVVFLTDNLKERWQQKDVQSFIKDLPNPVRIKVIETGASPAPNAWIASARLLQFAPDEDRWIHVEVGCNAESNVARSVRLTGISEDTQAVILKPGQITRIGFRLPASLNLQGQVAQLRLEPSDALSSDDVFFVSLDTAWALRVLLVEPEASGPDGRSVGLYLRVGMEVLAASKNQALAVTTRNTANVTADDFQKADVVFLAGVPELSDVALETLEKRMRAGAGLAVFLGPQVKPAFYNQKLFRPQQPAEGLMPLALQPKGQGFTLEGAPGRLTNIRWTHPLLALLKDPLLSDFTQSRFRRYGNFSGALGKSDAVLARFDDEVPAILERPLGAGRVLILNTSANDEWSDLPSEKRIFIPLLDRMLSYLSSGGVKHSFTVGAAVTLPLADYDPKSEVAVVTPSGAKLTPRLIAQRGMTLLHLDDVAEAGSYRVERVGKNNIVFAVNAPRTDSPLSPMDGQALKEWFAPAEVDILSAESAGQQLGEQSSHWPLWPALVFLAGLLLIAETIYVHLLCPRANPKTADAVVPQRGVLKPVGEKAV